MGVRGVCLGPQDRMDSCQGREGAAVMGKDGGGTGDGGAGRRSVGAGEG